MDKTPLICELEQKLNDGCKVILFRLNDAELFREVCKAVSGKQEKIEIRTCADYADECGGYPFVSLISPVEMDELMDIYYLYEFSDKVIVLSENSVCPGMMNYVRQGILDKQSVAAAVIYNMR
ncbi:MAG: hypothetical protein LUE96_08800 [Lachnospiraceae bacterium]|nr:hypothetical protein [Lachnospiraceae bacterium]